MLFSLLLFIGKQGVEYRFGFVGLFLWEDPGNAGLP
jgi:hypothetical protein